MKHTASIVVLHEAIKPNARTDETDALVQVQQVCAALRASGWLVTTLATDLDLKAMLSRVKKCRPACVFNLVESLAGDGRMVHFVPTLLNTAEIAHTGAGGDAIYLSSNKRLAKTLMGLHQIPTPDSLGSTDLAYHPGDGWIVKSVWEHASFGMDDGCVVRDARAAHARIDECAQRWGGDWFGERYIDGREFNISVLEQNGQPFILPIAEMTFNGYPEGKPKIVGYAAKWHEQSLEYHATRRIFPHLTESMAAALRKVVHECWTVFDLKGYARIDLRIDAAGNPWVLEVNANPCLSQDAGFAAAAQQADISYQQLIEHVVAIAINPRPLGRTARTPPHSTWTVAS